MIFISIIALTFCACETDLPNGGIPSYVLIDTVSLSTTAEEGSNSHSIDDIWVETEGVNYGAYELPAVFPVLSSGKKILYLRAGILQDGRTGFRAAYPFYTLDSIQVTLLEKDTIHPFPEFEYLGIVQFPFMEDFEVGNGFNNLSIVTNNQVFEGSGSGLMQLNDLVPEKNAKTLNSISLPFDREVYIELNYKANNFFNIKLEGEESNGLITILDLVFIAPKTEWNKIYIKLTDDIALLEAAQYKFIINAVKNDTLSTAEIFIDNFKVVHL